jgi:hypothetical protein
LFSWIAPIAAGAEIIRFAGFSKRRGRRRFYDGKPRGRTARARPDDQIVSGKIEAALFEIRCSRRYQEGVKKSSGG